MSASAAASISCASSSGDPSDPSRRPSSWRTSSVAGGAPTPGSCGPNVARRRIGGERRDDRGAVSAGAERGSGRVDHRGRRGRLHEHIDRAAAREPDVPRLLVADAVADDAGVTARAGLLDLLGRGAFHAAAADRARDPAIGRVQEHGALGTRRRPERPHDHGPADVGTVGLPCRQGLEQFAAWVRRSFEGSAERACGGGVGRLAAHDRGRDGRSRRPARGVPRALPPRSPAACRSRGRHRGSRPGARGWPRSPRRGSHRCTGTPRACRRPAADSPGVPASGLSQISRWQLRRRRAVSVATSAGSPRSQPSDTTMTTPEVRSVRRAHFWLNVRNDFADPCAAGPVVDRLRDAAERPVAVAVPEQARHPGQPRPEHERLGADLGRGRERLHEPQEQPRVALHRPRDVADDHERARLADRPPPDPVEELAARAEVAPEHRPRREPSAVGVELVAARPAALEVAGRAHRPAVRPRAARPASSGRTPGVGGPRPGCRRPGR